MKLKLNDDEINVNIIEKKKIINIGTIRNNKFHLNKQNITFYINIYYDNLLIESSSVLLCGLGGVGSIVATSLVRIGFKNICLIDCDIEKTRGRCGLLVGENFNVALNADLSLPTYALIEMMAQTAAATIYSTVVKNNQLPPVKGLLLSVRNFKNYRNSPIPKGEYLIANSTLEYSDENFKQVTANVVSNQIIISEATLTVYAIPWERITDMNLNNWIKQREMKTVVNRVSDFGT